LYHRYRTIIINAKINLVQDSFEMDIIYLLEIQDEELTQKNKPPKTESISNEPGIIGSGSGFFVTADGHIITNNHVVEKCEKVFLNNETLELIAKDPYNDLAILKSKIENNEFLYLKKTKIKKGEDVLVIGYPYGKDFGDQSKITKGIVSSLQGLNNDYSRIQIDAAIQPRNSGGPTLDSEGNVMGVTVSTASVKAFLEIYNSIPQNMNFAIKSNVVEMMLEANNINTPNKTNNSKKEASEIIKEADPAIVYLECYGNPQ
jgi:serine protease Do